MAILKYIEQTKIEEKPIKFQCDVCKRVFELTDEYDIKYYSDLKYQMAVLEYYYPLDKGGDGNDIIHCCSTDCLAKAIKTIPFDAKITIPMRGFYKK